MMPRVILFELCSGQKKNGRTDRQTDGQTGGPTSRLLYATIWGHKNYNNRTSDTIKQLK